MYNCRGDSVEYEGGSEGIIVILDPSVVNGAEFGGLEEGSQDLNTSEETIYHAGGLKALH